MTKETFRIGDPISLEQIADDMKLEVKYEGGLTRHVRIVRGFVPGSEQHSGKGSILAKCYAWPDSGMPLFEKETEPPVGQQETEIIYAQDFKTFYTVNDAILAIYYQGIWSEEDRKAPHVRSFPFPAPRV